MSKHTPEPWFHHLPSGSQHTAGGYINASADRGDDYICAVYGSGRPCDIVKANALRIVSCVNACAGIEDPEAEIAELKRQRDELLGLIKAVTAHAVMVRVDGTDCAAIPYFEYKVISDKVSWR